MNHRKLRIAWSVTWGVVAVLLVALGARSYRYLDDASCSRPRSLPFVSIASSRGRLLIGHHFQEIDATGALFSATYKFFGDEITYRSCILQNSVRDIRGTEIPLWLFAITSAAIATIPWFRWNFSLRTLLIATTFVAVGLGLIVWRR